MSKLSVHSASIVHEFKNGYLHIEQILVPAVSSWQFRRANASRAIGMPYWLRDHEEGCVFLFQVTSQTTREELEEMISKNQIYIRKCDADQALINHQDRNSELNFENNNQ